jgi:hypothetical protein
LSAGEEGLLRLYIDVEGIESVRRVRGEEYKEKVDTNVCMMIEKE